MNPVPIIMVILAVLGVILTPSIPATGLGLIIAPLLMYAFGISNILNDPPHVGLLTIWGIKTNIVIKEGKTILANYFPFFITVISINVVKRDVDFVFRGVRCRKSDPQPAGGATRPRLNPNAPASPTTPESGGTITVNVAVTYEPESKGADSLKNYIRSGKEKGVNDILEDMLGEVMRQAGESATWEAMAFGKQQLTIMVLKMLCDLDDTKLRLDFSTAEFRAFIQKMGKNGVCDMLDLGIRIRKLNIGEIIPEGALAGEADKLAEEEVQRRAETFEVGTEIKQAEILRAAYKAAGEVKTLADCILEIRRRKTMREGHGQVVDIPGLEGLAATVAAIFNKK